MRNVVQDYTVKRKNMETITVKAVFDRKNVADTGSRKGLVQIRVTMRGKSVYVSTGIKLFKNQWDGKRECVKNSFQADEYNNIICSYLARILRYRDECAKNGVSFDFVRMRSKLHSDGNGTFLDFMERRIKERGDIRESTRKAHLSLLRIMRNYGRIVDYGDLTFANVRMFDDWLHRCGLRQTTVWGRHKILKSYISEAIKFGLLEKSPYIGFRIERGKSEEGRYISEDEMQAIMRCEIPVTLEKVRDLMIVEFYTGLSVSDLMSFDFSKIEVVNGHKVLLDTRKKTNERYYIVLFPPVLTVIEKYGGKLPVMTMQQYDMRMKIVAEYAGLNKPRIASHWLRRGYGMMLLNKGVPLEVVSKSLGHTSIKTTEATYAKLLGSTVVDVLAGVVNYLK